MEFCPSSIIWRRWPGNIERSTHAMNYAALASANLGFLRERRSASATVVPPKTLTIPPTLEQHNAYRGGKTTLCGTRGEIAFMANQSRALLWTVVVIV